MTNLSHTFLIASFAALLMTSASEPSEAASRFTPLRRRMERRDPDNTGLLPARDTGRREHFGRALDIE
jgi:hypothetical protein